MLNCCNSLQFMKGKESCIALDLAKESSVCKDFFNEVLTRGFVLRDK